MARGSPHRLRLKAPSGPAYQRSLQDVPGGIFVTSQAQATVGAPVPAICERLGNMKATPGTGLRCASWIHRYYCPTGARSLVSQDAEKWTPAGVTDGLGQHAGRQTIHVEVLDGHQSVLAYQRARYLVVEVAPLVGYV